ncbi:MAG: M56 family metallopeptidase, partial [Bacteroidota bacterium]
FTFADAGGTWWNPTVFLFWVVVFWGIGLLVGTVRLGLSFGRVRRMQGKVKMAVPTAFRATVKSLATRIGYSGPLHLRISPQIEGPALVGHFKPILLFPIAMLNQLTTEQAEAVILHELAHLKRQDHWWNLLQCVIEVLFYYHPVVWWIGARIREEREHCCDDLVLRYGSNRIAYAKALLYFEHQRATPATAVALTNNPTGLLGRVKRFLHQQNIPYQMKSRLFLLPLLTLVALVSTAVYSPDNDNAAEEVEANNIVVSRATVSINAPLPRTAPAPSPQTSFPAPTVIQPDSLPTGRHQVSSYRNGKSTKVLVEDREIKELEIDGKVIPESEFDQHEAMVERLLGTSERRSGRNFTIIRPGDAWEDGGSSFRYDFRSLEDLDELRELGELEDIEGLESLERLGDIDFLYLDSLQNFGTEWEELGLRLGEMGERMGRSFQGMFDNAGGLFRFHYNGDSEGPFIFDMDSIPAGSVFKLRSSDDFYDRFYDQDEESSEAQIREMETMIEKLERRKAEMKRDLESSEKESKERTREMRRRMEERSREMR